MQVLAVLVPIEHRCSTTWQLPIPVNGGEVSGVMRGGGEEASRMGKVGVDGGKM